jgi:hypothetical protein
MAPWLASWRSYPHTAATRYLTNSPESRPCSPRDRPRRNRGRYRWRGSGPLLGSQLVSDTGRFLQDTTQLFVYWVTLVRTKPDLVPLDVAFEYSCPREQRELTSDGTRLGVSGAGNFAEVEMRAGM